MQNRFQPARFAARWLAVPRLTSKRIWLAYAVAVLTDGLQFATGPLGWAFLDEGLDVVAMLVVSSAIGFHPLLLPTFVLEAIPILDVLPTWTGCTAAVILLRKRAQSSTPAPPTLEPAAPPQILPGPPSTPTST